MKFLKILAIVSTFALLVSCGDRAGDSPKEPADTKATAAQDLITDDDALRIALEHAESSAEGTVGEAIAELIKADKITDNEIEFTALNGIPIYDCKFKLGQYELEYKIDSQNGAIRSYVRGFDEEQRFSNTPISGYIGEDSALSHALWYLDIKESYIENPTSVYNSDLLIYVVSFTAGGNDYLCAIEGSSGQFLRSTVDIGPNGAEEIAYNHAYENIAEDQRDDFGALMLAGVMVSSTDVVGKPSERQYEVVFKVGGYEYDYLIDGLTSEIIKIRCEPYDDNPVGGFDANTVSLKGPEIPDYFEEYINPPAAE